MQERLEQSLQLPHPEGGFLQTTLSAPNGGIGSEVVLYVHGFGSVRNGHKARAVKKACTARDWTFVAADFRGHGRSSGTMLDLCGSGLQADLDVVLAHLTSQGMRRLYLVGSSMGGWASSWLSLRRPELIGACALLAPSFDFANGRWNELSPDRQKEWQTNGKIRFRNRFLDVELGYRLVDERERFPVERLAQEWQAPALIIHGMKDEIVPYQKSLAFVEQLQYDQVELRLIKDGDHRLQKDRERIAEEVCRFFACWM